MKLSKHQKEIIKKIISNEVFDIKSYLQCFNKQRIEKYDLVALKKLFDKTENNKKYKVIKEGFSIYDSKNTITGIGTLSIPLPRANIPEEEYELKPAKFIDNAPPIRYTYNSTEYEFDFIKGVNVIKNFEEVLDFLTLWNYLKQENLILEVNEPLSQDDIGMFFEPIHTDPSTTKIEIKSDYVAIRSPFTTDVLSETPKHFAHEYSDITWKINDSNLIMCNDFLGKKIIRTSALITFAKKNFKTNEQISQNNNFRIALIALVLSVISIIMGNVVPLFQKQPTEYMDNIVQQLSEIRIELEDLTEAKTADQKADKDLKKIIETLEEIEQSINASAIKQ